MSAEKRDYIPSAFNPLGLFLSNLLNMVSASASRLGIDPADLAAYQTLVNDYLAANAAANILNAGKTDRLTRQQKAKIVKAATRVFVNENLRYNKMMTDEDRSNMGLPIPDHTATPVPVPSTVPLIEVRFPALTVIEMTIRDSGTEKKAKPFGVHGVEICWAILDDQPLNYSELFHSSFFTHQPVRLQFLGEERGKIVYFAARWENTRGEKGNWNSIQNTIIP